MAAPNLTANSSLAATTLAMAAPTNLTHAPSTTNTTTTPASATSSPWMPLVMDEITQTKLIASLVLFVITLMFGYMPVRMILNQNYIQHAMFLGGGVLMATAFCHLIPEAHDGYKNSLQEASSEHEHLDEHNHHNQPNPVIQNISLITNQTTTAAAAATTTTPTTTMLILNETIANSTTTSQNQFHEHQHEHDLHVPYPEILLCCGFIFMYVVEQLFLRFVNNHTHEHPGGSASGDTSTGQLIGSQPKQTGTSEFGSERDSGSVLVTDGSVVDLTASDRSNSKRMSGSSSGRATTGSFYKFIRGLLIVSAFSLHSIFDGVAIGSQDSVEKVWTIFFAISCHKLIIVAVVGFELFSATLESHLWTLIHLTIFSVMSPIGILLVVLAQSSLKISSDDPAIILLQSFATGTLLYIIFVEILQPKEDRFHSRNRPTKILSLIVGFAAMVAVLTFMHED